MASAKLLASEFATAVGILILECLLRYAKDHSSALILGALCLNSAIDTLAEWCERVGEKPKLKKMDYVHLVYSVATVVCSSLEFMKISGYEAILGHFEDVPFGVAIAIAFLVLLEILVLLIRHMISKGAAAAGTNGLHVAERSTTIDIPNNPTGTEARAANRAAIGANTLMWTTGPNGANTGATLSLTPTTPAMGATLLLTAQKITFTVSNRSENYN